MHLFSAVEMLPMVPEPGTTEAIELGCTCQVIGHQSALDEAEPSSMLTIPSADCPLHTTIVRQTMFP
jgi:hypothetical protein